jgi:hypothetical protein
MVRTRRQIIFLCCLKARWQDHLSDLLSWQHEQSVYCRKSRRRKYLSPNDQGR